MFENENKITVDLENNNKTLSNEFEAISLKITGFTSNKFYDNFLKNVKHIIVKCIEYRTWRSFIVYHLQRNKCLFSSEQEGQVSLNVHHHPFSMEQIIKCVMNKYLEKNIPFSTFDIAYEVVNLHYMDCIGYTVLTYTLHEKFHNGFLKIPIEFVYGNWKKLLKMYTFEDEVLELIQKYTKCSLSNPKISWDREIELYYGLKEFLYERNKS